MYRVKLRTKNHSASELKTMLRGVASSTPFVVRLGSRTPIEEIFPRSYTRAVEINSVSGINNSRNKATMKARFDEGSVKTAEWAEMAPAMTWNVFPAIIKHKGSHGGEGIFLIESAEQLQEWTRTHPSLNQYIIEKFYNYTKEYRLHVDKDGCFYTCRKMLKSDATERWHRHDSNSVWIVEENDLFEKPSNWNDVVAECVKALNAVGLTLGACDVKIQSEKGKRSSFVPDFIVMEINSAPSMGEITTVKYFDKIKEIVESHDRR